MVSSSTLTGRAIMFCLLFASLPGYAFTLTEDAIETVSLRMTLNDDNTGYVQGKVCDYCKLLTIPVTAETKAFRNDMEVPLKQALTRVGKPATVFTNIEHTMVTRIVW